MHHLHSNLLLISIKGQDCLLLLPKRTRNWQEPAQTRKAQGSGQLCHQATGKHQSISSILEGAGSCMMSQSPQALVGNAVRPLKRNSAEMRSAHAMPGIPHLPTLGIPWTVCLAKVRTEGPAACLRLIIGIQTASHPRQCLLITSQKLMMAWHHRAGVLTPHAPCPYLLHMQTAGPHCQDTFMAGHHLGAPGIQKCITIRVGMLPRHLLHIYLALVASKIVEKHLCPTRSTAGLHCRHATTVSTDTMTASLIGAAEALTGLFMVGLTCPFLTGLTLTPILSVTSTFQRAILAAFG